MAARKDEHFLKTNTMEKIKITKTYKQKLWEAIVKYRVMPNKTHQQRSQLISMEIEYRALINLISENKVSQYVRPKSERTTIERKGIKLYWNPIVKYQNVEA